MLNPAIGGTSLAAGSISQAIGDIFRGQAEAQQQVPALQANAEAIEGAKQQRQVQMMKLPAELAREQQGLTLGQFAIKRAPLEYDKLKGDVDWENVQRGWQSKDYAQMEQAKSSAMTLANRLIDDPATDSTLRNFLGAIKDNPTAIMTHFGKMAEQQNHYELMGNLEKLKAMLHPKTMEQLATEGMTSDQASKLWIEKNITLKDELNQIRQDVANNKLTLYEGILKAKDAQAELYRAHAEFYRSRVENPGPEKESLEDKQKRAEITRRQVQLRGERGVLEQRIRAAAQLGKPDLESKARLNELVAEERALLQGMPGATQPTRPTRAEDLFR